MTEEKIKTYDPKKGHKVLAGKLWMTTDDKHKIFIKRVNRKKHYFKLVSGYAIQSDVYENLKKEKVDTILIKEEDTGNIYLSSLNDWNEHQGKGNWGHGRQYVLSTKYMKIKNNSYNK